MADHFGFSEDGCFYVQTEAINIEGSGQREIIFDPQAEGFIDFTDPDLLSLFKETEGELCPMFLKYGREDVVSHFTA